MSSILSLDSSYLNLILESRLNRYFYEDYQQMLEYFHLMLYFNNFALKKHAYGRESTVLSLKYRHLNY